MVTNNEAVENFLNGKRNLAAYQFSQLISEIAFSPSPKQTTSANTTDSNHHAQSSESVLDILSDLSISDSQQDTTSPSRTQDAPDTSKAQSSAATNSAANCDEIAFNYAMVNLFTGCPKRASIVFNDLVKRYPRNPRLWLRLAESMLASERLKLSEFEHIQELTYPHARDHLIKTKNKPILIKINPHYCQQQMKQKLQTKQGAPSNFLVTIRNYLRKSFDLINEYNDISLLNDDIPASADSMIPQQPTTSGISNYSVNAQPPSSILSTAATDPSQSSGATMSNSPSLTNVPKLTPNLQQQLNQHKQSDLSNKLSYVNPYKSISRSALYHLRNKVALNLAYVYLCMGEPIKALTYTTECLKYSPQGYEKVLVNLYHAEACILASRIEEAIQFLNLEILNMAKSLAQDHPLLSNNNSDRVIYGEEMQRQVDSNALAMVVTYNLSVAYAAKGEFNNAQKILTRCAQLKKPNPMQVIICLLYIQLQQGQLESAKRTILNNLPQFR